MDISGVEPELGPSESNRTRPNATIGFDPMTSGLWAQRASSAPRCILVDGIEPTTSGLLDQHSNQLSYTSVYTLTRDNLFKWNSLYS